MGALIPAIVAILKAIARYLVPIVITELAKKAPQIASAVVGKLIGLFFRRKEKERPPSQDKVQEINERIDKEVENETLEDILAQSNAHMSGKSSGSGDPSKQ